MNLRQKPLCLCIAIAFVFLFGCSDDENNTGGGGGGGGGDLGEVSFDISGDIEGQKSGIATVLPDEDHDLLQISLHDYQPQTFSMTFMQLGSAEVPAVGEYSLGAPVATDFNAFYTNTEAGHADADEYNEFTGEAGTLEITESSATSVSGTFELTLQYLDEDTMEPVDGREIVITNGQFTAPVK